MGWQAAGRHPDARPSGQTPETTSRTSTETAPVGLPLRAILLVLLLIPAVAFLTSYVEFVIQGTQIGSFAPSGNAILPLFILALLVNPLLRRLNRRWALQRRELIGIYAVLLAVAVLTSCQFAQWVVPVSTGPYYYATPYNGWKELLPLIPSWWAPGDPEDIRRFYEGPRAGEIVHWSVWWKPLLAWGPFVLVLYLTALCVIVLLRRAWTDNERLPFPLVQLPLEMTADDPGGSFFRSRLMWLGVLIPTVIHSLNGLHYLFPTVPSIATRDFLQVGLYVTDRPWNAIQPFWLDIYFCLIGFAFLSARDVPFSMWFFFLLYKAECVLGASFNWTPGGEDRSLAGDSFPLIEAQHVGSVLMLVGIMLWAARSHLRAAVGRALGRRPDVDDRGEPLTYRMAFFGTLIGFILLTLWCVAAGMPPWAAALTMLVSMLFLIAVHRMMAEGGVNFLWAAQSGTNYLFFSLGGASFLPPKSWLVLLSLPYFVWNFKGPVGPQALEGFKLLQEIRVRPRRVAAVMVVGMLLAMLTAYWSVIYLVHTHGGGVALDNYRFVHVGQRPFMELQSVQAYRGGLSLPKMSAIGLSALFTWFLGFMRWRFLWWRLHPLGYAVSTIWAMNFMWFSMFLGSTASWLITRFGGLPSYRKARPFFLGLILGDFLMLGFWLVLDAFLDVRGFFLFGH
jgi:hypothetical protein